VVNPGSGTLMVKSDGDGSQFLVEIGGFNGTDRFHGEFPRHFQLFHEVFQFANPSPQPSNLSQEALIGNRHMAIQSLSHANSLSTHGNAGKCPPPACLHCATYNPFVEDAT